MESLAETLSMKEQQLQRVREREEELEQQNSAMRNEFNQKIQVPKRDSYNLLFFRY